MTRSAALPQHLHGPDDHLVRPADVDVAVGPRRLGGQLGHGAEHDVIAGRLVGYRRDDLQPRVGPFHLLQVSHVVEVLMTARPEVKHDLAPASRHGRPGDRLDDRLDRGQPGAARQAQDVPRRVRVRGHHAVGRAEHQRVPGAEVMHEGGADQAAANGADVQPQRSVLPRGVRDGVPAPQPGPMQCLHADVLTGAIGQRLLGRDGEDRDVGPARFNIGDSGDPPGRGVVGIARGGVDHDVHGVIERAFPGVLRRLVPPLRGEPVQGGQQRAAEHAVVLITDPELAVSAPQMLQVRLERGRVVLAGRDADEGTEEPPALHAHGGREHRPDLGIHGE